MNCLARYQALARRTLCPFARHCRVVCAPEWDKNSSVQDNIALIRPHLDSFVARASEKGLDIFVVCVEDPQAISSIEKLAGFLYVFLSSLRKADPTTKEPLTKGIETPAWDFVYRRMRFFVPTFAPFYAADHPRYSNDPAAALVLFQTDLSFDRFGISKGNPNRRSVSQRVWEVFHEGGSAYDLRIVLNSPKAERYIKPALLGQEPVRWWKTRSSR